MKIEQGRPPAGERAGRTTRRVGSVLAPTLLALGLSLDSAPVAAGPPEFDVVKVTPGELALLPEYCAVTQDREGRTSQGNARQQPWIAVMGETFWAVHHYCWGLLKAKRAEGPRVSHMLRVNLYASAIDECNYVVNNAPADFVLLPEIFLRIGQYNAAMGNFNEALDYFNRSRTAKRDYWPPYVEIAKLNMGVGLRQPAIDALADGLAVMPNEQRLLDEMKRVRSLPERGSRPGK